MGSRLVGVHLKGTTRGKVLAESRNELALEGTILPSRAPLEGPKLP